MPGISAVLSVSTVVTVSSVSAVHICMLYLRRIVVSAELAASI
jgi:hypothetical protein